MANTTGAAPERPGWALPMVGAFGCLLVLLIAGGGGGVWYWKSRQATPAPPPVPTTEVAPTATPGWPPVQPSASPDAWGQPPTPDTTAPNATSSSATDTPAATQPQLAAAAPFPPEILRTGGSVREPRRKKYVPPAYPQEARHAGIQGLVKVEALLDVEGRIADVRIARSIPALDQAAAAAVRLWLYEPTLINGQPVPVVHTIELVFKIEEDEDES